MATRLRAEDLLRIRRATEWAERTVARLGHTVTVRPTIQDGAYSYGRCEACHSSVTIEWGDGRVHGQAIRGRCARAAQAA